MKYEVGFPSERAEKEFFKTLSKVSKKERDRILEWFDKLAENQRPEGKSFKPLKGEIIVYQFLAQYRIRESNWQILYDIDESKKRVVVVVPYKRF